MSLTSGSKLGPYEIQAALGVGGMGEVYRARDTRLGRDVAIKVLPSHLSSDEELKERFQREARAISSLNHAHICTLHDVGEQGGVDFLVMEFLEGETLQQRLLRGPLPLKQVLEFGIQIAEALDLAHQAGIAHRDLKPGNIMLTKSGAKLLDFGLAKPVSRIITGAAVSSSLTPSTPTMTVAAMSMQSSPLTQRGMMVGTFQYLAPEVLHGKEADARSDIFALGAVLYEMITGKHAFEGKSQLSVMTAILEHEPGPIANIPGPLEHVVRTCLAKDPAERWQSAREVVRELRWAAHSSTEKIAAAVPVTPPQAPLFWCALLITAIVVAAAATYYLTLPTPGARWMASLVPPPGVFPDTSGRNGPPQISPDGKNVAFTGCKSQSAALSLAVGNACSIWVRALRSSETHEVDGTAGGFAPFWSPDSREIGFFADGKIKRVPVDGGPVQVICDASDARGGTWGSSGMILFAATRGSPIFSVSANGGAPVAVTQSGQYSELAYVGSHRWPYFLPDGEHFLYFNSHYGGSCGELSDIQFASLDGKQNVSVLKGCGSASFADGRLIFWREGNLVAQPFDPKHGVLSGNAVPIADHVAFDAMFGFGVFSASSNGLVVYRSGSGQIAAQLAWYDRSGKTVGTIGDNDLYDSVAISPDGSRVATNVFHMSKGAIMIMDSRGSRTLTTCSGPCPFPVWSGNGREIYFTANSRGPYDIFVKAADGSGGERPVVMFEGQQFGAAFLAASPDGKYLAFASPGPTGTIMHIYIVPLQGDHKPQLFHDSSGNEGGPVFSPDGKWLAFESSQSGRGEVYITPFPGGGAQYQVSTSGGERPVWRRDGKEIYYRENLRMMAVKVNAQPSNMPQLGTPSPLFEAAARNRNGRWYDVAPDGRFLMNTAPPSSQAQNFELVVNWPAELQR
jgi:eukaryotic-like serine/threonine-protein kinase